jgi:hypothetical protein
VGAVLQVAKVRAIVAADTECMAFRGRPFVEAVWRGKGIRTLVTSETSENPGASALTSVVARVRRVKEREMEPEKGTAEFDPSPFC